MRFTKASVRALFQHRVPAFDLIELAQHRLRPRIESVAQAPLDVADPDRGAGDLGGEPVDLDAVEDFRASAGGQRLEPQLLAFIVDAEFEVLHALERHVEKIARAAGRVENA